MKKLIAAGWESYRANVLPADASEVQIEECKQAFMSGAAILFTTIMNVMSPGAEPTESDFDTMSAIQAEIDEFGAHLDRVVLGKQQH